MAISISPLAPGRPAGPRELLAVPGQPQALDNRPAQSPGRIPVPGAPAGDSASDDSLTVLEDSERQKRESLDYQILEKVVKGNRDHDRVKDREDAPSPLEQRQAEQAQPPVAADGPDAAAATPPPRADRVQLSVSAVSIEARRIELRFERERPPPAEQADPLALDLDGNGLRTTGVEGGVQFDINADGRLDQVSVTAGSDAFLALDRNNNGRIDDGRELFGDQNGASNGFEELSRYDDNTDGRIDARDSIYSQLQLLRFSATGGQSLSSLEAAGVSAIDLGYRQSREAINQYDSIAQLGSFDKTDGTTGTAGDLLLGYRGTG